MKIGFISNMHEDIEQLKQALRILEYNKCAKIVCLGDIVGYDVSYHNFLLTRNASKVIKLTREKCNIIVVGNHDLFAIKKIPKYKAGFRYSKNWYNLDYWKRKSLAEDKIWLYEQNELSALLTKKDEEFISKLPEFIVGKFNGVRILLSHYAYPDLVGATKFEVKTEKDTKEHFEFMKKFDCMFGVSGHDNKDGIMRFTNDNIKNFNFGKIRIDKNNPTWLNIPSVAKGSFTDGVTIFDTNKFEIKVIPIAK